MRKQRGRIQIERFEVTPLVGVVHRVKPTVGRSALAGCGLETVQGRGQRDRGHQIGVLEQVVGRIEQERRRLGIGRCLRGRRVEQVKRLACELQPLDAGQRIGAIAIGHRIAHRGRPQSAVEADAVVADGSGEHGCVGATEPVEQVVAGSALQGVVACGAADGLVSGLRREVVAGGAGVGVACQVFDRPGGKLNEVGGTTEQRCTGVNVQGVTGEHQVSAVLRVIAGHRSTGKRLEHNAASAALDVFIKGEVDTGNGHHPGRLVHGLEERHDRCHPVGNRPSGG